jgi:hypothetical protein
MLTATSLHPGVETKGVHLKKIHLSIDPSINQGEALLRTSFITISDPRQAISVFWTSLDSCIFLPAFDYSLTESGDDVKSNTIYNNEVKR